MNFSKLEESINKNTEEIGKFIEASIKFNKETSHQTEKMIKMTKTMKTLTWVMVFGLIIQILLTINYDSDCVQGSRVNHDNEDAEWSKTCITRFEFGPLKYSWRTDTTTKGPF